MEKSGKNFGKWELFTRLNELRNYEIQREKRTKIYLELKELLLKHKNSDGKLFNRNEIKNSLFGPNIDIKKLLNDPKIPPLHEFNLYLKATQSEEDLDKFYKKCDIKFKKLIFQTKDDIENLRNKLNDPVRSYEYEKRNIVKYHEELDNLVKEIEENRGNQIKEAEELTFYKQTLISERKKQHQSLIESMDLIRQIKYYASRRNYDLYNLTEEQSKDVERFYSMSVYKKQMDHYLDIEKENEYAEIIKSGKINRKIKEELYEMKKEIKKKLYEKKIHRPEIPELATYNLDGIEFLLKSEIENTNIENWKSKISKESLEKFEKEEQDKEELMTLRKKRENFETMLWRFFDRAVKKKNKPRLNEMDKAKRELQKLESENAEKEENLLKEKVQVFH